MRRALDSGWSMSLPGFLPIGVCSEQSMVEVVSALLLEFGGRGDAAQDLTGSDVDVQGGNSGPPQEAPGGSPHEGHLQPGGYQGAAWRGNGLQPTGGASEEPCEHSFECADANQDGLVDGCECASAIGAPSMGHAQDQDTGYTR